MKEMLLEKARSGRIFRTLKIKSHSKSLQVELEVQTKRLV
jgi:hypothetical protein